MEKKADILITVENPEGFEKCLAGAIIQKNAGKIIVADKTRSSRIKELTESAGCSVVYITPGNGGGLKTFMELAAASETQWLKFIYGNAVMKQGCVENLINAAESFEDISMSFCAGQKHTKDGRKMVSSFDFPEYISGHDYLFNIYPEVPLTSLSNTLIRRDVLNEINLNGLPDKFISFQKLICIYAMLCGNLAYENDPYISCTEGTPELPDTDTLIDDLEYFLNPCFYGAEKHPELKKRLMLLKESMLTEETVKTAARLISENRKADAFRFIGAISGIRFMSAFSAVLSYRLYAPYFRNLSRKLNKAPKE